MGFGKWKRDANHQRSFPCHECCLFAQWEKTGDWGKDWTTGKNLEFEDGKALKLTLKGHTNIVKCIAFSPDGKRLATGTSISVEHGVVKIWDLETGENIQTLEGHTTQIVSVAFSSDGKKLATGALDRSAKIWDWEKGKEVMILESHTSDVSSVAFSPDGKLLATAAWDKLAKIWDLDKRKVFMILDGHTDYLSSVEVSPDGNKVATGSYDRTAKIWEITPHGLIQRWQETGPQAAIPLLQLQQYTLESLLDIHPDNEQKLIATNETWQIKAFADLAASQAAGSNILAKVEPSFTRAERLYAAALALQDERLIRQDYANMLRRWAEVCRADGQERRAKELGRKADGIMLREE